MSSDNGIYLHKFRNGWRVVHTQAIDNIYFKPDKSGYNQRILRKVFQDSPLFKTRKRALNYAVKLYDKAIKEYGWTEYGICEV